jgi:hypothetical protein
LCTVCAGCGRAPGLAVWFGCRSVSSCCVRILPAAQFRAVFSVCPVQGVAAPGAGFSDVNIRVLGVLFTVGSVLTVGQVSGTQLSALLTSTKRAMSNPAISGGADNPSSEVLLVIYEGTIGSRNRLRSLLPPRPRWDQRVERHFISEKKSPRRHFGEHPLVHQYLMPAL